MQMYLFFQLYKSPSIELDFDNLNLAKFVALKISMMIATMLVFLFLVRVIAVCGMHFDRGQLGPNGGFTFPPRPVGRNEHGGWVAEILRF